MLRAIIIVILGVIVIAASLKPDNIKLKNYHARKRVVCSLTTRPVQPKYFTRVLDRLVEQFDAVYLALPSVSCKGIKYPTITHPGVTIVSVEKDYGPITKFFGILNSNERDDTIVVILDDDIIYDPNMREIYEKEHLQYPSCVISGSGVVYKYCNWGLPWFMNMTGRKEHLVSSFPSFLGSRNLTTVTGYTGICFKRGLINREDLLTFIRYWNQDKDCFFNDDIVFSAFLSSRKISRIAVKVPRCVIEPDKDTPNLSDVGPLGTWPMQHKVLDKMRDCFRHDNYRPDCICLFDVIVLIVVILAIHYAGILFRSRNHHE